MIRKIIVPQKRTCVLELPEEYVGKEVEVRAFEVNKDSLISDPDPISAIQSKEERLKYLIKVLEPHRVDMSDYAFDRNEANSYD